MTTFCILALFSVACAAPSTSESVRISFSQKALDLGEEIANLLIEVIQDEALTKSSFPDISTSKFILKNLKLKALNFDKPELSIVSNVGLMWRNANAHLKISGDYSVKVLWWWKSGSLDLETIMEIKAAASITAKKGKLATYPAYCGVEFNKFDLDLHNGFISWVAGLMKGSITPEIENAFCSEVNGLLRTTANEMIASLPHNIPVGDVFSVKIEADSNPSFKSGLVDFHARVKLDKQGSATIFPFSPEPMQSTMDNSYMACLLISDYTLNTGSFIALSAGTIDLEVPNDDIDGADMNTEYLKSILPELYTAYPNMSMSFKIVNTRYPKIEFDADEVFINIPVDVSVMVNDSLVFDLAIDMTVEAALSNVNNVVLAEVVGSVYQATLVSSVLSDDITDKLDDVVDFVLTKTVLPELNVVLTKGIDIPTSDYVILKKGLLEAHDDFLKVCGDIELTDDGRKEILKAVEDIFD